MWMRIKVRSPRSPWGMAPPSENRPGQGEAEPNREEAGEKAPAGIEQRAEPASVFDQRDGLVGERREGREGTAETDPESRPSRGAHGLAAEGELHQEAEQERADHVHRERAEGKVAGGESLDRAAEPEAGEGAGDAAGRDV